MDGACNPGSGKCLELRVTRIELAGRDTLLFCFAASDGSPLPPAEAGSHITLKLPDGRERQYSVIHPGNALSAYTVAIRSEATGRGGSAWLHDNLRIDDTVHVVHPRNNFPLAEDVKTSILIGGGIGVTPLIAMAERLAQKRRHFIFHAAFRSRQDYILEELLSGIPEIALHFDDTAGCQFPLTETLAAAPEGAHLYCCGPTPMIEAFISIARAQGRPENTLHYEYFAPLVPDQQAGSFVVELARSGLSLTVAPGRSILETVREAGINAVSSCEQGTCGDCEVKVIEGVPDHFDAVLTPREKREGKSMMICCSGALTDKLVIDL